MKDKKWLKDEVSRIYDTRDYWSVDDFKDEILDSINELDEPEVLSQEWIEEYAQGDYDEWIYTEDLQNLIVPKQELPVVPTWFDEWWKDVTKGEGNLFHNIEQFYDELFSSGTREMYNYISGPDNKKKLLDIIVNELEYVVESEQRYYAKIKGHELLSDREDSYWNVDREELYIDNIWHDYSGYKTTKLSKYDWNNLGINEDNADFVKVEGVE